MKEIVIAFATGFIISTILDGAVLSFLITGAGRDAKKHEKKHYSRISHTHCWDQKKPSACGIPMTAHAQCCLCDMKMLQFDY